MISYLDFICHKNQGNVKKDSLVGQMKYTYATILLHNLCISSLSKPNKFLSSDVTL